MGHGTGGRNHTLDFLKGFAICMVVFTHFEWRDAERALPLFPYLVDMAVPIFMVISGYTYAMSMERHGITTLQDALSWDNIKTKLIRYTAPFLIIAAWELIDKNIHVNAEQPLEYLAWIIRGTDGKGSYYYPLLIQLIFVFYLLIFGATAGVGIFTAQYHGKGDTEGIRYTFRFKIVLNTILSALSILAFLIAAPFLVELFLHGEGDPAAGPFDPYGPGADAGSQFSDQDPVRQVK